MVSIHSTGKSSIEDVIMYYFDDVDNLNRLETILSEWKGTPYRHHCGVKGLGCDCIHFVARVVEELGLIKITKNMVPTYPKDWHLHNSRELLSEAILKHLNVEKVGIDKLKDGDIVLMHYGKAASHAAFYFKGYLHQALNGVGVTIINASDRLFKRQMKFAYRVIK